MNVVSEKIFQPYNLANPHFSNTEITLENGNKLKGQFVQFKVVKGDLLNLYPAEQYCFLPQEFKKQFWREYESNHGEFREFPKNVMLLSLKKIKQFCIIPDLIIY